MIVDILFVITDLALASYIKKEQANIIPKDILASGYLRERGARFYVNVFVWGGRIDSLSADLGQNYGRSDAILVLFDDSLSEIMTPLADSCFVRPLVVYGNHKNMLARNVAASIREFTLYSKLFDQGKFQTIFLLPFNNFDADDYRELRDLMRSGGQDYAGNLPLILSRIKGRQRPKKRSSSEIVYFVDDSNHYYSYGHERHARVASGVPPHEIFCGMNSELRFGRRYDSGRHFNVSLEKDGDQISFTFADCHGAVQPRKSTHHVNIFPNGFVV